jgi:hypothetical protein
VHLVVVAESGNSQEPAELQVAEAHREVEARLIVSRVVPMQQAHLATVEAVAVLKQLLLLMLSSAEVVELCDPLGHLCQAAVVVADAIALHLLMSCTNLEPSFHKRVCRERHSNGITYSKGLPLSLDIHNAPDIHSRLGVIS